MAPRDPDYSWQKFPQVQKHFLKRSPSIPWKPWSQPITRRVWKLRVMSPAEWGLVPLDLSHLLTGCSVSYQKHPCVVCTFIASWSCLIVLKINNNDINDLPYNTHWQQHRRGNGTSALDRFIFSWARKSNWTYVKNLTLVGRSASELSPKGGPGTGKPTRTASLWSYPPEQALAHQHTWRVSAMSNITSAALFSTNSARETRLDGGESRGAVLSAAPRPSASAKLFSCTCVHTGQFHIHIGR